MEDTLSVNMNGDPCKACRSPHIQAEMSRRREWVTNERKYSESVTGWCFAVAIINGLRETSVFGKMIVMAGIVGAALGILGSLLPGDGRKVNCCALGLYLERQFIRRRRYKNAALLSLSVDVALLVAGTWMT